MDPNVALYNLLLSIASGDLDEAEMGARDLAEWIGDDGFQPTLLSGFIVTANDVCQANARKSRKRVARKLAKQRAEREANAG